MASPVASWPLGYRTPRARARTVGRGSKKAEGGGSGGKPTSPAAGGGRTRCRGGPAPLFCAHRAHHRSLRSSRAQGRPLRQLQQPAPCRQRARAGRRTNLCCGGCAECGAGHRVNRAERKGFLPKVGECSEALGRGSSRDVSSRVVCFLRTSRMQGGDGRGLSWTGPVFRSSTPRPSFTPNHAQRSCTTLPTPLNVPVQLHTDLQNSLRRIPLLLQLLSPVRGCQQPVARWEGSGSRAPLSPSFVALDAQPTAGPLPFSASFIHWSHIAALPVTQGCCPRQSTRYATADPRRPFP